ncbi:MAG: kinase-like domain-containing protein [Benjaminiella poitrasii]|nr:MAG: kinase-like domain-containing protein [Benjaminiella poitrasii]
MPYQIIKIKWLLRPFKKSRKKEKRPLRKNKKRSRSSSAIFLLTSTNNASSLPFVSTATELGTEDVIISSFNSSNGAHLIGEKEKTLRTKQATHFSSSSRQLYTIPETTNINSTTQMDAPMASLVKGQGHYILTEEEIIKSHQDHNEEKNNSAMVLIEDEEDYIPVFEWPSLNTINHTKNIVPMTEEECKAQFSKMVMAAYHQQQLLEQYPREMHLLFEQEGQDIEGISIIFQDGTREDYLEFKGFLQYLAPELSTSTEYHHEKIEIWSLGISLYYMLIGKYPFAEDQVSHRDLFTKMLKCNYEIPKSLSEDAGDLIRRMLSFEHSRASFDLVMFHPWLKSYIPWLDTKEQKESFSKYKKKTTSIKSKKHKISAKSRAKKRMKKAVHAVRKVIILLIKGPYPPPSSYRDIVVG